jgi:hypothetical protein
VSLIETLYACKGGACARRIERRKCVPEWGTEKIIIPKNVYISKI